MKTTLQTVKKAISMYPKTPLTVKYAVRDLEKELREKFCEKPYAEDSICGMKEKLLKEILGDSEEASKRE